mgnify:CR=1 FL=1
MLKVELDAIDLRILKELQRDGRMTNVELSERVGISAPPCLRRVRKLEEAGFVAVSKSFNGRKPLTEASLTDQGRDAFVAYLDAMAGLLPDR